jgi:CHAT domain-containing protein/tetratricopeptide (TPR) repeat protein
VALFALIGPGRPSPHPVPDSNSFEYVQRLIWLNNWAEAADALRALEDRGLVPTDSRSQILCEAVKLRGHVESGQLQSAAAELRKLLERPEAAADTRIRLTLLSALGDVLFQFDLREAEAVWQSVHETADRSGDSFWNSRSEGELGAIAFLNGDMKRAVRLVGSTALRAEANGDVASQIRAMTALGEGLASFGRPADALRFFDRALRLHNDTPGAYFPFTAYVGKARLVADDGRPEEAKEMLEQGLAEARQKGLRIRETRLLSALAALEEKAGEAAEAYRLLTSAADLAAGAGMFRIESDVTTSLADLALKLEPAAAGRAARRSVEAAERAGDLYSMPRKLAVLAEALSAEGDAAAASATFERATQIIEDLLGRLTSAKDKNTLIGTMDRVFRGHFRLAVEQLNSPGMAFGIVESARARGLIEAIRHPRQSELKAVSEVSPELVRLHLKLGAEADRENRQALIDRVWETEVRSYRVGDGRTSPIPHPKPVSLAALQRTLMADEVLIEYVLGDTRSYALVVGRTEVQAHALACRKEIETLVDRYLKAAMNLQNTEPTATALYRLLVEPVSGASKAKRIVIVPDGKLHALPFDALMDRNGELLLSRAVVSYAPSASVNVYLSQARISQPKESREMLAVGGVPYGSDSPLQKMKLALRGSSLFDADAPTELADLPGSSKEIAQITPLVRHGVDALIGAHATESAVKRTDLSRYRVVHFAVHASMDEQFPDRSALRLAREAASKQDGLLQAREVIGLELKAELVTLSACDAGSGRVEGLAGLNSLVQAFLMAGAHSVVASTWPAEDNATAELMRLFYSHLRSGADKAEALTLAKRDLIAKYGSNAQPFLWAGFRLVGDPYGTLEGD